MPETITRSAPIRAAVVYTRLPDGNSEAQQDILDYVETVSRPLQEAGYNPIAVPVTLNLADLVTRLQEMKPVLVFNLVDALHDHDQLLYLVPSVLESFEIPCTGVNARGNFLTTDKILAKEMLRLSGIPTPSWQRCDDVLVCGPSVPMPCIVKPVAADASRGMDDASVCPGQEELVSKVTALPPDKRGTFFTEHFIDGREFNISVLAKVDGIHVLPPAEMMFMDYPEGKPTIVDFRAKWMPDSFEFNHTIRRFEFPDSDIPLLEELKSLSLRCWNLFGLTGYARVDFRVDRSGKPWVLEVNANPCISPDAGFVAAGERAGMSYRDIILAIVDDTVRREARRSGDEEQKARRRARRKVLDKKR